MLRTYALADPTAVLMSIPMSKVSKTLLTLQRRSGKKLLNVVHYNKNRIIFTNYGEAIAALVPMDNQALLENTKKNTKKNLT